MDTRNEENYEKFAPKNHDQKFGKFRTFSGLSGPGKKLRTFTTGYEPFRNPGILGLSF